MPAAQRRHTCLQPTSRSECCVGLASVSCTLLMVPTSGAAHQCSAGLKLQLAWSRRLLMVIVLYMTKGSCLKLSRACALAATIRFHHPVCLYTC